MSTKANALMIEKDFIELTRPLRITVNENFNKTENNFAIKKRLIKIIGGVSS